MVDIKTAFLEKGLYAMYFCPLQTNCVERFIWCLFRSDLIPVGYSGDLNHSLIQQQVICFKHGGLPHILRLCSSIFICYLCFARFGRNQHVLNPIKHQTRKKKKNSIKKNIFYQTEFLSFSIYQCLIFHEVFVTFLRWSL